RVGFTGLMVPPEKLVEVATSLRDQHAFNYLSSVTGVDLFDDNMMEVVYHFYSYSKGGGAVVLKTQVDRNDPVVPSLTPEFPGADFQEREAWDLLGIKFSGHPDLRRILMWEGFAGHPLRKDWKEPFFEEMNKPFGSRWPDGLVFRAEERNPYGKNVQYPAGWTPEGDEYDIEGAIYEAVARGRDSKPGLKTDKVTVNLGPQHPSTHGVFRMVVTLDGENVIALDPVMGYLHRNHEKIGERNTWLQNIPYTDRLDYLSSLGNNHGYVMAVEKLLGIKPPERVEWIRILMDELTRLCNHFWALGFFLNDLGALQTPMLYLYIERELILDFFEATTGARMMCNYMRFGGLAYDLPLEIKGQETTSWLTELVNERLPAKIDEWERLISGNEIVRARCIDVAVLTAEDAMRFSCSGPLLRASGVPYDIRRAEPYSFYDQLDFDVAVRYNGDLYDRYLVRIDEMRQSLRILRQVIPQLVATSGQSIFPEDEKPQYAYRTGQGGDSYGRIENPKGELGYYITAGQRASNADRYHIRAPSFINLTALEPLSLNNKVADLVAILGSIDIVLGEVDR
ncbi:MAG: NADH-quinone oxidoreductase subunit D, partial [Anaerolineales bacterium]|nr:NADH-quinone oxidoreductase subunit D [Anaerolineales bacterium]